MAIALATKRKLEHERNQISEPIAQTLVDPRNLEIARAISQRVKPIKNQLLLDFGTKLHFRLGEKLKLENLNNHWKQGKDSKDWTKTYASSSFWPIRDDERKDAPLLVAIIQRTNNFVNLGISRSEEKTKRPSYWEQKPVRDLEARLKKNGYDPHQWWLGYTHLYDLREDDLYLALAGNMDEIVEEAVGATWKLFSETREMIEKANQALAKFHIY